MYNIFTNSVGFIVGDFGSMCDFIQRIIIPFYYYFPNHVYIYFNKMIYLLMFTNSFIDNIYFIDILESDTKKLIKYYNLKVQNCIV